MHWDAVCGQLQNASSSLDTVLFLLRLHLMQLALSAHLMLSCCGWSPLNDAQIICTGLQHAHHGWMASTM